MRGRRANPDTDAKPDTNPNTNPNTNRLGVGDEVPVEPRVRGGGAHGALQALGLAFAVMV